MAPSSLKKMSRVQEGKEGNNASLEKKTLGKSTNHDLGLTLLPGSQIRRKDEKSSGTAAESSPKQSGSKYVGTSKQSTLSETETQLNRPAQRTIFPNEAKSPSSSPDPGPESAKSSHVTSWINREWLFSRESSAKDSSGVAHHNVKCLATAPYVEQIMVTGEVKNADSCQNDASSPRAVKRRKFGSRASNGMQDSKVSEENEAAFETHYHGFRMYHDQNLSEVNVDRSGKGKQSGEAIRDPYSGTGGGLGFSKPKSQRQITQSPGTAPARSHQHTNVGSELTALHGSSSVLAALASRSRAKHQDSEPAKLTVHYQPSFSSKSFSTQHGKHPRLFPDAPADIGTQVLKPRKEVNRSWTRHFPAKAKILHRANLPAPSLLAASFTPSDDCQHPHPINTLLNSTHLHAYTPISNAHSSLSLPSTPGLSKAFNYPLDICALEDTFHTARATDQPQSLRRRSASVPNLPLTSARLKMDFANSLGPASMQTPPREKPCSLDQVDTSCNADSSYSQIWQYNSNALQHHGINLSDSQSIGFISAIHPHQIVSQVSNQQHMSGAPQPKAAALDAGGQRYNRPRLEVKPNYGYQEVKSLVSDLVRRARTLEAENTNLQSVNAAMKKGCESLQHGKADLLQQIQLYERTIAQKDQLIKIMQQQGSSLHQQYKRIWDEHRRLLITLRKKDGTGKPSIIAQKIRRNHSPSALGQGRQPSANASPLYCSNSVQLSAPSHEFEQTPTGFQGHGQPMSVPGYSDANVINSLSRSLRQPGHATPNPNTANPSQSGSTPAYSEANVANISSPTLSQPRFAAANYDGAKLPQPVSIPAYQEANVANASVQPGFAAANHNKAHSPHNGSTGWVPSNQPLGVTARTATTNGQNNSRPTQQVPTERVTIDLTDDSQSPSSSASPDTWVHQTRQSSVQSGYPPFNLPLGQYPPAQYPAGYSVMSQYPSGLSARGEDLEAMQIQKEAFARIAEKPLSWLKGENPFRKGTELPNSGQPSQINVEEHVLSAQFPEAGLVAPLPETATRRTTKKQAPKKTKVVLDADAKKERAKLYRKTFTEKKKREKELTKQALQDEDTPSNAMLAQKQDRRAAKGEQRREQARKPSEAVRLWEPQRKLDGRLYQEDTGVQQAIHEGSMEQAASDDRDSLFDESPDTDIAMHDNAAAEEQFRAIFAAEIEAGFDAEADAVADADADVDAGKIVGFEQGDASDGHDYIPTAVADIDHGFHDFSDESEEE